LQSWFPFRQKYLSYKFHLWHALRKFLSELPWSHPVVPTSAPSTSTPPQRTFRLWILREYWLHVECHDLSNPGLRWSADGVTRVKVEGTEGGADDVSLGGGGGGGGRASI